MDNLIVQIQHRPTDAKGRVGLKVLPHYHPINDYISPPDQSTTEYYYEL